MPITTAFLALALAEPHPNSLSGSTLSVAGARVEHEIVLQGRSLLEVLPGSDANGDEWLDAPELEAARAGVLDYLDRNYRLRAGPGGGETLAREVQSLEIVAAPPALFGPPDTWVRVVSSFTAPAPIEVLAVEMRLFFATSPDHRDLLEVRWDGERAFATSLSQFEPEATFRADELPFKSSLEWLASGAQKLATNWDRLAFLLALLLAAPGARGALRTAFAYALAHAAGYAVAAVGFDPLPTRFLGLSVALASAFAGAQVLSRREPRALILEALVFGAIGGQAFGNDVLQQTSSLLRPAAPLALSGLGMLGALLVLSGPGVLAVARARRATPERMGKPTIVLAALVTLFGLYRFALRAGWL